MDDLPRSRSVAALKSLLEEAAANPTSPDAQELKSYLGSQGRLARYSNEALGIEACSLNTMKRACVFVDGGFDAVDALRRRALAALSAFEVEPADPTEGSKRQLQRRAKRLRERLDASTEDLILMTRVLEMAMRQAKRYAIESGNPGTVERCNREQSDLRDMLSLRQVSLPALRVVQGAKP